VLLCTDVAARGLDFPAVSTIIQYDPAGDPAEYVHRVGRTARMGQQGEALLFLLHSEMPYIDLLQQRGMQLQPERAEAVLRCLPALLVGSDPAAAGSVHRLAKKLRQEAGQAAAAAAGGGGKDAGGDAGGKSGRKGQQQQGRQGAWMGDGGLSGAQAEGQAAALMLQRQLLQAIAGDDELQKLALNAFRWVVANICGT
jgi:superfamily II DNA/RNA helicase